MIQLGMYVEYLQSFILYVEIFSKYLKLATAGIIDI